MRRSVTAILGWGAAQPLSPGWEGPVVPRETPRLVDQVRSPVVAGIVLTGLIAAVDLSLGAAVTGVYAAGAVLASLSADPRRTAAVSALCLAAAVVSRTFQPDQQLFEWFVRAVGLVVVLGLTVLVAVVSRRLRRRVDEQARLAHGVLATLAVDLSGAITVREVAERFVQVVTVRLRSQSARVYSLDEDDVLRSLAWHTHHGEGAVDEYGEVPVDGPLPGAVAIRERRALHLTDRESMDAVLPGLGRWYEEETSLHVLPLVDGPRAVGLLALSFKGRWTAGRTERALVETLAQVLSSSMVLAQERQHRQTEEERTQVLAEAGEVLEAILDPDQLLAVAARLLVPGVADWCSVQLLRDGVLESVVVEHKDPSMVRWAWELTASYPVDMDAEVGAPVAVRTGESQLLAYVPDQLIEDVARDPEMLEVLRALRITSSLVTPLLDRDGAVLGTLNLVQSDSARHFNHDDVTFVEAFARRVSGQLANARSFSAQATRLAEVTRVAEAAQRAILAPPDPRVGPYRLAARYVSAAAEAHVGGDLYEAVPYGDGIRLLVGDVRGKGLGAVRTATIALGEFRSAAADVADLEEVPRLLDRRLSQHLGAEDFVTALVVELDADGGYRLLSCGHPRPVAVRSDSGLEELECQPDVPLGLGSSPTPSSGRLAPGERLVLFTDGLVEARLADRSFVSTDEVLKALADAPFDCALDGVLDRLADLVGADLGDDLALVLAEFDPVS